MTGRYGKTDNGRCTALPDPTHGNHKELSQCVLIAGTDHHIPTRPFSGASTAGGKGSPQAHRRRCDARLCGP